MRCFPEVWLTLVAVLGACTWGCGARGTSLWGQESCFSPEDASEAAAETGERTLPQGELPLGHQNSEGPSRLGTELEQDGGWKERPHGHREKLLHEV